MHKYEQFKMDDNETIYEMFARFTNIINGLKALGRNIHNVELINKSPIGFKEMGTKSYCYYFLRCPFQLFFKSLIFLFNFSFSISKTLVSIEDDFSTFSFNSLFPLFSFPLSFWKRVFPFLKCYFSLMSF